MMQIKIRKGVLEIGWKLYRRQGDKWTGRIATNYTDRFLNMNHGSVYEEEDLGI